MNKNLKRSIWYTVALSVLMYLGSSIYYETPNPFRWQRIGEERKQYKLTLEKAINYADKNKNGKLNLTELADLYARGGYNPNVEIKFKKRFRLPRGSHKYLEKIPQSLLEEAIESYETKRK